MTKSKSPTALSASWCVPRYVCVCVCGGGWGGGLTLCQPPDADLSIYIYNPRQSQCYITGCQSPRAQEMPSSVSPERKALSLMLLTSPRAVKLPRLWLADQLLMLTAQWNCWLNDILLYTDLEPGVFHRGSFSSSQGIKWWIDQHSLTAIQVLLYVHRNRRLIRDGSPGRPPRPSHSSWTLSFSCSQDMKIQTHQHPFSCSQDMKIQTHQHPFSCSQDMKIQTHQHSFSCSQDMKWEIDSRTCIWLSQDMKDDKRVTDTDCQKYMRLCY